MRLVLYLLLFICAGCTPAATFRLCPNLHTDPTKRLYNDIVTELIEQRFYNVYLPEKDQKVFQKHYLEVDHLVANVADAEWHEWQSAHFQNKLFGDTSHFQTLYLNTSPANNSLDLAELPDQFTALSPQSAIVALINRLATNRSQAALDSLNRVQSRMRPSEFQLCTARLQPADTEQQRQAQGVGTLTLSRVVFSDDQEQAILSFSWHCGPRCGFGEVLLVEQVAGRWRIKQAIQTWIS
ncbi:LPS-assembly lipoprotein LptE [Hymenobacter psychrophilus]|uniref:hypothetical protein n=1 Tax=Hymenobacter psychrophilus TaxID=651662 RepID=UPI000B874DE9|nr:hypothetical protein [Hymenobacter psychrophilus]